ncbi:acyl-CoA thioesterase [Neomegalonema sp.]|uniref:acyl-CoA thioesterase n=1 Tax=Neomegalonema sp. TaxID=2039713 RepID=UPI00262DED03|nr:acyl-CoA thioesterase [Neomegalonema sp.]MDD2868868.1 acyl-CoA thioesterase [Neomegalonema sp.]
MYPFVRLIGLYASARRRPALTWEETSEFSTWTRPWDCDMFGEMNNGRHLTLLDLGRFDYAIRIGMMEMLRKQGWGLVVGGGSVRYRRRLLPFDRFSIRTRLAAVDDKWFYFQQSLIRKGEACSSALMRTAVTRGSGTVPTAEVAAALGVPDFSLPTPDWVRAWIEADAARPWPPDSDLKAPARRVGAQVSAD